MRLMILHHRGEIFPVLVRHDALPQEGVSLAAHHADVLLDGEVVLPRPALGSAARLELEPDCEGVITHFVPDLLGDVPVGLLDVAGAQHLAIRSLQEAVVI